MTAGTVTYLYGYGKTRHIASKTPGASLCGHWFMTETELRKKMSRLVTDPEARIKKKLQLPVCKLCEKSRATSSS